MERGSKPAGEIDFSDEELAELGIALAITDAGDSDNAEGEHRRQLRIPVEDEVPRSLSSNAASWIAGGTPSEVASTTDRDVTDQIVDEAFQSANAAAPCDNLLDGDTHPVQKTARPPIVELEADPEPLDLPTSSPTLVDALPIPDPEIDGGEEIGSAELEELTPSIPLLLPTDPAAPTPGVVPAMPETGPHPATIDLAASTMVPGMLTPPPVPSDAGPQGACTPIAPEPPFAAAAQPSVDLAAPEPAPAPEPTERTRRKRRTKPWFEELFDEDYLRTLPTMTPQQTERETTFIVNSLGIRSNASLLDIGCGYGRHAMLLADRGHTVTGLDLSLPLLIRAADAARRANVQVNFVHGDMRELSFNQEFDAAYCYFTTFGYFDDDTNRKVAAQIGQALKPGGRLLLEVINRDYLIRHLPTRVWWEGEGCVVLEEVEFNYFTSRLQVQRSIVFDDGRQTEHEISIRAYSLHEIGKILHRGGFRVLEVSGGLALKGQFFGTESRQILVVAEKRDA